MVRIRRADFVMIPMWVIEHPEVRGNSTRVAVYAGLRAVAFESPDMEWRSTREVARSVGEIIGLTEEACRKHLSALVGLGAVVKTDDEISTPNDPPELGTAVGTTKPTLGLHVPNVGTAVPNGATRTSTSSRDSRRETRVASSNGSTQTQALEVPSLFDAFWSLYPRKIAKPAARKAWKSQKCDRTAEAVMAGLDRWLPAWAARNDLEFVPHPATWLNQRRWEDEVSVRSARQGGKASTMDGLRSLKFDDDGMMVDA